MGTLLDITLYHHDARKARRLVNKAFSLAEKLDSLLSNYKPQSEVSRLNRKGGKGRVQISPEFYDLLLKAKELTLKTEGAFDITVGPLVELWQSARRRRELPSLQSLRKARALVGMNQVILYPDLKVELKQKGIRIETGGIGKGYAVDLIVRLFRQSGIKSGLVNFGQSSVYAIGSPPGTLAWKLLVRFQEESPLGIIKLKDRALSASDSLGRSFEGKRYGHLIDPQTGIPLTERIRAVVLAPSATEAEALSKYVILKGCMDLEKCGEVEVRRIVGKGEVQCAKGFPLIPLTSSTRRRRTNRIKTALTRDASPSDFVPSREVSLHQTFE